MFMHGTWWHERRHYLRNVIAVLCVIDFVVGVVLFALDSREKLMLAPASIIVLVTMLCAAFELVHMPAQSSTGIYAVSITLLTFLAIVAMIVTFGLFIGEEMPLAAFFIIHGTVLAIVLALKLINERKIAAIHATTPTIHATAPTSCELLDKPAHQATPFPTYPPPDPTPKGGIDLSENARWNVPPLLTPVKGTSRLGRPMGSDLPRAPHRKYTDEERYAPNTRTGGDPEAMTWDRTDSGFDSACMG